MSNYWNSVKIRSELQRAHDSSEAYYGLTSELVHDDWIKNLAGLDDSQIQSILGSGLDTKECRNTLARDARLAASGLEAVWNL
jgi:hypothetical protein